MGVGVIGQKPTNEYGEYICYTWWAWRPLADYVCQIAPEITAKCKYWQSNDCAGLNAEDTAALADKLQVEIEAGRTLSHAKRYMSDLEAAPLEPCDYCDGTGKRKDMEGCNSCRGAGYVRQWHTHYPFHMEAVQDFVKFLRSCGGFEIH